MVSNGDKQIKHGVVLTDREDTFEIKDVKNSTYKLNAETCGVCESQSLSPTRHSIPTDDLVPYQTVCCTLLNDSSRLVKKLERRTLHSLSTIGARSLFLMILQTRWAYLAFLRRMGLVQDAAVLASSGYAKTSSALSLLSKMGNEKENLGKQTAPIVSLRSG